jgi:hypothetical protein
MLEPNISPYACEPRLLTLCDRAQTRLYLRTQRTLVRVEYVQQKIIWPREIKHKISTLIPC